MTHGSLFSGIGGFDLAAQWMGWKNIFHCEINKFCQTVLKHHFPNSILYENIKETDFTKHRRTIDVLSGGFPCQPYSVAGKRKGKEDERHLWPEMCRAIREIQPTWVIGENVSGLINWNGGMVFEEVQTDLETEGYEVIPFILPAAGINAPHKRDRVWFVAKNTMHGGCVQREFEQEGTKNGKQWNIGAGDNDGVYRKKNAGFIAYSDHKRSAARFREIQKENGEISQRHNNAKFSDASNRNVTNSDSGRQSGKEHRQTKSGRFAKEGIFDNWQNFPTQPPICCGDDGLSTELDNITFSKWRNESIKAYGNAVVPQIPFMIFQAIKKFKEQ